MNKKSFVLIVAALTGFAACVQRTDAPTNRDGIAGGSNVTAKQETPTPKPGPERERAADIPVDWQPKTTLGDNEYTVLVGSYVRREQAEETAYALRMQRINNFVDHVGDEWLVCVGEYHSANGARNTLKILRQRGFSDAVIYGPGHMP